MPREIEAAVRAYIVPKPKKTRPPWSDPGPSRFTLVFDTETLTDLSQRLRVLAYQVRNGDHLAEKGFAYDPDALTSSELEALRAHALARGSPLLTHREWVSQVFERVALQLCGFVVGHNLGFDISRIASGHGRIGVGVGVGRRVDRSMLGGLSYALPGSDLRIQVKRTSARGAFIRLALGTGFSFEKRNRSRGGNAADHRGYFVDTGTLGGALLGGKLKLKRLAELLGTEHRKTETDLAGPISPDLLDYAANDVQVTWECFVALRDRYRAFGLTRTPIWRVHSEASIAKGLVREMGVVPWRESQPDFDPAVLAALLETYYGGRVGCGIRALAVPGVLLDFASQYPTASALLGLWPYHVARGIEVADEDPSNVQSWLGRVTVDDILDPATWLTLHAIVEVDPNGSRLPTRAKYGRAANRTRRTLTKSRNVALPVRVDHRTQWWTLLDAAASVLETGRAPHVIRVLRFRPLEPQTDLGPIDVAGDTRYRVDPYGDDVIRRLVELRMILRVEASTAKAAGDDRLAAELEARAGALKKSANSLAYGVPIEVNVTDYAEAIRATVVEPNGASFAAVGARRDEQPGEWFNPLLATLVVSGGRLLLAAAMRLVRDAGGTYAYWDTDGLFVVATETGGSVEARGLAAEAGVAPVPALARDTARAIADRFASLNPYDRSLVPGSILSFVPVNYDPETGVEREVWCLSLAAKRYCLFTLEDGRPRVARSPTEAYRSEHGLGHLLPPDGAAGAENWITRWWEHLVCIELGISDIEPAWFSDPALGPLTIGSTQDERAFGKYNSGRPYSLRVRPGGFGMVAHVSTFARTPGTPRVLVAAREDDRAKRRELDWFDRADPSGRTYKIRTGDPQYVVPGTVAVQSYGDYFVDFRSHPEEKELGPDGEPCRPSTRGQLKPSTVYVTSLVRIGKEANRLSNGNDSAEAAEFGAAEYRQSACAGCGKAIPPNRKWCSEACRKRQERRTARTPRTCLFCGHALSAGERRWCSEACRKRHTRAPEAAVPPSSRIGSTEPDVSSQT
jgi:predicted nucleic acid-binding Zn ribbon protein